MTYHGHKDDVNSAVFSRDGGYILTASFDKTARLWERTSGKNTLIYRGHERYVSSAVFSPDGEYILTASFDDTARLWDRSSGKEIMVYRGHKDDVNSAVFSPDGEHILTSSDDQTARLWDRSSGKEIMIYRGHEEWVRSAVFSPDAQHILTASFDGTARLWDRSSGKEIESMPREEGQEMMELWEREKYLPYQKEKLRHKNCRFSLHDADGKMLWQSWHLDEGWMVANKEGEILRASPEAWPYISHIAHDEKTGLPRAYPAQTHPYWNKLTRDNKDT